MAEAWRAFSRPVTDAEIFVELEKLQGRYHAFEGDPKLADVHDDEWLEDLEGLSIGQLKTACKAWRMSPKEFAPRSAGQLIPLAGQRGDAAARIYEKLAHIARMEAPVEPAKVATDAERAAMRERMGKLLKSRGAKDLPRPKSAAEKERDRVKTVAELREMAKPEGDSQ